MTTLAEVREQFPMYSDMSDAALADALHHKFYSDIPRTDFFRQVGLIKSEQPSAEQSRYQGYLGTQQQMAGESFNQMQRGADQLRSAFEFAGSGAGRDLVPDTPNNRVAGAFSAVDPSGPQAPLTEGEHAGASGESVGNLVKGFGNTVAGGLGYVGSPVSAVLRTAVGNPVERTTGIPREYAEFAASFGVPGRVPSLPGRQATQRPPAAPSIDQLRTAARTEGYQSPAVTGLQVTPTAPAEWANRTRAALNEAGLVDDPQIASGVHRILERFERVPEGAAHSTGTQLEAMRQALQAASKSNNGPTREAARRAIDSFDEFLPAIRRPDVVAGNPQAAAARLTEARGNWSAAEHAALLDRKQLRAELRSGAANSGMNVSNNIRQRIADILVDERQLRGFSPESIATMERIVHGTGFQNAVRTTGNVAGGGGGALAAGYGVAGTLGSGPLAAVPLVGWGLKTLSNNMALRDLDRLNALVRSNSPLGRRIANPLQDWSRAAVRFQYDPNARHLAMITLASRNLSNNLKDAGIVISPSDLMRSLQGPVRGGTEDEQR